MIKRIISILCVAVLVLGVCGCATAPQGNEEDTKAVLAAIDKFASCESFSVKQVTESTEVVTEAGEEFKYDGTTTVEFAVVTEPDITVFNSKTIVVKAEEGEVEQSTISYLVGEDGVYTEYFTDGSQWYQVSTEDTSYVSALINAGMFTEAFFVDIVSFAKAGEDNLDSGKAVRYEGALGGDNLMGMLESVGYFYNGISSMSEKQQAVIKENLAKDLKPVTVKVWVDEASSYPVKFEVSLTGMLEDLEKSISKSLGNKDQGEFVISDYVITMTVGDFNSVGEIVIPAEAFNAQVFEA